MKVLIEIGIVLFSPFIIGLVYLLSKKQNAAYLISYIILIVHIFLMISCFIVIHYNTLKKDWNFHRCKVPYIFFSGYFDKTSNETIYEATKRNGKHCSHESYKYIETEYENAQKKMEEYSNAFHKEFIGTIQKTMKDMYAKVKNLRDNIMKPFAYTLFNIKTSIYHSFISMKTIVTMILSFFIVAISIFFSLIELGKSLFLVMIRLIKNILIIGFIAILALKVIPIIGTAMALVLFMVYIPIVASGVTTMAVGKIMVELLNNIIKEEKVNDCYKYIDKIDCVGVGRCLWLDKEKKCQAPYNVREEKKIEYPDNPYINNKDGDQIEDMPESPFDL